MSREGVALDAWVLVLVDRDSGVVVEALSSQHLGQVSLASGSLLQLGAFVLEPDLDLSLVQAQLIGKVLSSIFIQVTVVLKLFPQPG